MKRKLRPFAHNFANICNLTEKLVTFEKSIKRHKKCKLLNNIDQFSV